MSGGINLKRCAMRKFLVAFGSVALLTVSLTNAEQTLYEKLGGKKAIDADVQKEFLNAVAGLKDQIVSKK
jgi:hypothetical protein